MTRTDYVPTGFEKGHPAWDISAILTRHAVGCERRNSLVATATVQPKLTAADRLHRALLTTCTCEAGDSIAEITSVKVTP